MKHVKTMYNHTVADAARKGLSRSPKSLPSWLFYDEEGDRIFQQIMRMPEYYPTRCEYDILRQYSHEMLTYFQRGLPFQLIELGAGDGLKSEILLKHFAEQDIDFTYIPVDISANALDLLSKRLMTSVPGLRIEPWNKSYEGVLSGLRRSDKKKFLLFMGANIGNFAIREAVQFLKKLAIPLHKGDMMLIGFDLKKEPRIIHEAYDDPRGLTASFNLNILRRLNREVGADFDLSQFSHYPSYDPETGTTKSFLVSMKEQAVRIEALEREIRFSAWETIQTEISQKYDIAMIEKMMALSGLTIERIFCDSDGYFCDVLITSDSA